MSDEDYHPHPGELARIVGLDGALNVAARADMQHWIGALVVGDVEQFDGMPQVRPVVNRPDGHGLESFVASGCFLMEPVALPNLTDPAALEEWLNT